MSLAPVEIDGQYRAVRETAGALERPDRRSLQVAGPEAAEYLEGQLTNEIEALEPGEGCYAALLHRKGHMQADMRVLRTGDGLRLETEAVAGDAAFRHLNTYKVGREVTIVEVTDRLAVLSVIGPAAAELVLGGPAGPEHSHREVTLGGVAGLAATTDLG